MIFFKIKKVIIIVAILLIIATVTALGVIFIGSDNNDDSVSPKIEYLEFPDYFRFGAASAAFQIEGAWDEDDKGPSIWDTFTHDYPEKIIDGSNADDTAKSYLLYEEDVKALKTINADFYRFSISWPRVMPDGDITSRNQLGINYYRNLINLLIENGIEPMITMYHWDLPQRLQDLGGWTNPLIVDYFEQYAKLLFEEFGEQVKNWITFNEPSQYCGNGYSSGRWPPGIQLMAVGEYLCVHHTILAHARVYHLFKNEYFMNQQGRIGITLSTYYFIPEDSSNSTHKDASDKALYFSHGLYSYPLIHGDYPPIVREIVDRNSINEGRPWSRLPYFNETTKIYIKGTIDFLGLNYYSSVYVRPADIDTFPASSRAYDTFIDQIVDPNWKVAESTWLYSVPEGLYDLLQWLKKKFNNIEVIITENGWSDKGQLDDDDRIEYLNEHFKVIHRAIENGCNVRGHTTWSIIDNFEWLSGYTEHFGVFQVNMIDPELKRVEKKSVKYLSEVFRNKRIEL